MRSEGPLEDRFRALRSSMFEIMSALTTDSPEAEFKKAERRWHYFKRVVTAAASEPGGLPGAARRFIEAVYGEPAWRTFANVRHSRYRRSERFKVKRKDYDQRRYKTKLRVERSTPEERVRLAASRKRQRAAKRERELGSTTS